MKKLIFILALNFLLIPVMRSQDIQSTKLSPNLTLVEGYGGNSGILVTDKAVVVIDTKMAEGALELSKMVKEKAGNKPVIVINTHYHGDHTSGNHFYKNSKIYIGNYDKEFLKKEIQPEDMPNQFVKDSLVLDLGNETVVIYNLGQAHTFQDMVVLLKKNRTIFTGDIIFYEVNPFVIEESGANVNKWLDVLDRILAMNSYNTLVPGHGQPGGKDIATAMKDYFLDMKTAANDPSQEKAMYQKYSSWRTTPGHATPQITVQFIRSH